ncbi:MAG TPA: sulfurtransferase/chromate resistance protein [Allosphingosinicella sp.]|jgi:rhodanese-related sulfurtransferase
MPAINAISAEKLARLIGTPACPPIYDVRGGPDAAALPALIPGSARRPAEAMSAWATDAREPAAILVCGTGAAESPAAAAWLRAHAVAAETLDGGIAAWAAAGLPLVPEAALPERDPRGRTVWVTRARPKVDRIACPWLIRRFIDRDALFLFVAPADVSATAERFGATPFDVDGVRWSHRGELCAFDTMVEEFGLAGFAPLAHLARIVRGADTARPDLAPQCAGLLAASLGLSRMYADDHQQLEAGMVLYDALFRWCRDATDETHDWVSHQPRAGART